jgi:hypothetical protein
MFAAGNIHNSQLMASQLRRKDDTCYGERRSAMRRRSQVSQTSPTAVGLGRQRQGRAGYPTVVRAGQSRSERRELLARGNVSAFSVVEREFGELAALLLQ